MNSIVNTIADRINVLPRWGCAISSITNTTVTAITGRRVARVSRMSRAGRPSRSATNSTIASLATSEGWKEKGPTRIHRVASLTVTPNPGNSTTTSRTAEPTAAGAARMRHRW